MAMIVIFVQEALLHVLRVLCPYATKLPVVLSNEIRTSMNLKDVGLPDNLLQ